MSFTECGGSLRKAADASKGAGQSQEDLPAYSAMGLWPRVGSSVENADHPTSDLPIAWQLMRIGCARLPLVETAPPQKRNWMTEHAREYTYTESGHSDTFGCSESGWQWMGLVSRSEHLPPFNPWSQPMGSAILPVSRDLNSHRPVPCILPASFRMQRFRDGFAYLPRPHLFVRDWERILI